MTSVQAMDAVKVASVKLADANARITEYTALIKAAEKDRDTAQHDLDLAQKALADALVAEAK